MWIPDSSDKTIRKSGQPTRNVDPSERDSSSRLHSHRRQKQVAQVEKDATAPVESALTPDLDDPACSGDAAAQVIHFLARFLDR